MNITTAEPLFEAGSLYNLNLPRLGTSLACDASDRFMSPRWTNNHSERNSVVAKGRTLRI